MAPIMTTVRNIQDYNGNIMYMLLTTAIATASSWTFCVYYDILLLNSTGLLELVERLSIHFVASVDRA